MMINTASIKWAFAGVNPIVTLSIINRVVNLFFNKVLKEGPFWNTVARDSAFMLLGCVAVDMTCCQIMPTQNARLEQILRTWGYFCTLIFGIHRARQSIGDEAIRPHQLPPGPDRNLLELWGWFSESSRVKYSCYYNKTYPKKYDIREQFEAWVRANQTKLQSITVLDMSYGPHLQALPPEIGLLVNLKTLRLVETDIDSLPSNFSQLTKLKRLDLSRNHFTSWPSAICQFSNLEELDLSDNQINSLPEDLVLPSTLKHLDISHNQLQSLPASFLRLPRDCHIDAERNQFSAETCAQLQAQLQQIRQENPDLGPTLYFSIADWPEYNRSGVVQLALWPPILGMAASAIPPLDEVLLSWLEKVQQEFPQFCDHHPTHFPSQENATTCPALYAPLLDHEKAKDLATFLEKLTTTQDYINGGATRKQVVKLVYEMLQTAITFETFCQKLFNKLLPEANARCGDRATFFLNEIETEIYLANADHKSDQELVDLLVGIQRLNLLKECAAKRIGLLGFTDAIEVHLYYECKLKKTLNLPISSEEMLFKTIGKVPEEMLQEDAIQILTQTQKRDDIYKILIASEAWQKRVQKNHQEDFYQQDKALSDRMVQLEENTSLSEQDMRQQMEALVKERELKTRALIEEKTHLFLNK
jgi:Leucine-rich repeat (LRR) protein